MTLYYCGIGSRDTPDDIQELMQQFAEDATGVGLWLRSGGATGADSAFEEGCGNSPHKEIFLPWKDYNEHPSPLHTPSKKAFEFARRIHPFYDNMKQGAQKLIARNMHQILGQTLDKPVEFVICWTRDGCESKETYKPGITGGTGSAIALASTLDIPIFNLALPVRLDAAYQYVEMIVKTRKD